MSAPAHQITGTSEMSALVREHDWGATALGPIENWPPELVSTANLVLSWPTPMTLYWGPRLCMVYNDAYRQFLSGKHPASLGAPASEVWEEMWPEIGAVFRQVYDLGTPAVDKDVRLPARVDGVTRDEWWNYTLSPLYVGGQVAGLLNLAENRTQAVRVQKELLVSQAAQQQALGALAGSEQRLAMALQTAELGLWQLDLNTLTLDCSPTVRAAFGRQPEDPFSYQDLLSSLHPEDLPKLLADVQQAGVQGMAYKNEYRVRWPDGSDHWILASGTMLPAIEHRSNVRVGVVLDITERHKTTEALIQSEKLAAVGRLASSMAHEINNPLASVTNLLFLAKESAASPLTRDYLQVAERELRRVSILANQTLRFHRQSTVPSFCSCVDLISHALTMFEGRLVNANVLVEKRKRAKQLVFCFGTEIEQAVGNLIVNAIDALRGTGGRLLLRSREGVDWKTGRPGLKITVADTGTGMSRQTLAHLYEAFYTTKGIGGTGLGLWICAGIVSSHKGRLSVRSSQNPQHHGTVFCLFLPFDALTVTAPLQPHSQIQPDAHALA